MKRSGTGRGWRASAALSSRALDRILLFERGRIIEDGTHAALVGRRDGTYRRLFERQASGLLPQEG